MEKETTDKVIKMLLIEKEKFEQQLGCVQKKFREELLQPEERNATKTHTADYNMACSVNNGNRTETLQKILGKFDLAIERTKQGNYGVCTACERQIPIGRLKQIPFAELCVECKRDREESLHKQPKEEKTGFYFRPANPELRKIFLSPITA